MSAGVEEGRSKKGRRMRKRRSKGMGRNKSVIVRSLSRIRSRRAGVRSGVRAGVEVEGEWDYCRSRRMNRGMRRSRSWNTPKKRWKKTSQRRIKSDLESFTAGEDHPRWHLPSSQRL